MSDQIAGFTVTLKHPVNEEAAERLQEAIMFFDFIVSVDPVVADPQHHIAYSAAKAELTDKLFKALA